MATIRTYSATTAQFSPVVHWRFDEDAGRTAVDQAGALNGAYRNGVGLGASGVIGDGAAAFDGVNDFMRVAPPAAGQPNPLALTQGTIEMWFIPDAVTGTRTLFSKNTFAATPGDIEAHIRNGVVIVGMQNDTDTFEVDSSSAAPLVAGEAVHFAFTFGEGGMRLFLNGQLVDRNGFQDGIEGNVQPLFIGSEISGQRLGFFDGTIDEFAVYDQALRGAQIRALFEAGQRGTVIAGTEEADRLIGGGDDEVLRGRGGNDVLNGGPGNDTLRGGAGNDRLFGLEGRDSLIGDQGNDLLVGGAGRDVLTGRGGADTFRITSLNEGVDTVRGFQPGRGGDVLDIRAVLEGFVAGTSNPADFVRLNEVNGNTRVAVNPDGMGNDATPVFNLAGVAGLDIQQLVDDGNIALA